MREKVGSHHSTTNAIMSTIKDLLDDIVMSVHNAQTKPEISFIDEMALQRIKFHHRSKRIKHAVTKSRDIREWIVKRPT